MAVGVRDAAPSLAIPFHRLVGRRVRIGPFASTRDLVKFVAAVGAGALVASATTPWLWLPFVLGGMLLVARRSDGQGLDEQVVSYLRWRWRRARNPPGQPPRFGRGPFLRLDSGRWASGVRAGGVAVAYLPPDQLRTLFAEWRAFLRSLGQLSYVRMGVEPVAPGSYLPVRAPDLSPAETLPVTAYRELVRLLTRRRYRRVVDVLLLDDTAERGGTLGLLETQTQQLLETLGRMGVPAERLRDAGLARTFGTNARGVLP